jgi:hypothetical protein
MELEKQLIDIERNLWTNDAAFYKKSLIEDAFLVFPETGVIGRDAAVDAILTENARVEDGLRLSLMRSGPCGSQMKSPC